MHDPFTNEDSQVEFLRELVLEDHASIDGDVLEGGPHSWVLHGSIPYGGEVPMAVFDSYEAARRALDDVRDSVIEDPEWPMTP